MADKEVAIINRTICRLNVLQPQCVSDACGCMKAITKFNICGFFDNNILIQPSGHLLPLSVFLGAFSKVMDNYFTTRGKLLLLGDFNFRLNVCCMF